MGLVVAILTIGAAMLIVIQYEAQIKLRAENESLRQQLAQLKADNESLSNRLAAAGNSHSLADGCVQIGIRKQDQHHVTAFGLHRRWRLRDVPNLQRKFSGASANQRLGLH